MSLGKSGFKSNYFKDLFGIAGKLLFLSVAAKHLEQDAFEEKEKIKKPLTQCLNYLRSLMQSTMVSTNFLVALSFLFSSICEIYSGFSEYQFFVGLHVAEIQSKIQKAISRTNSSNIVQKSTLCWWLEVLIDFLSFIALLNLSVTLSQPKKRHTVKSEFETYDSSNKNFSIDLKGTRKRERPLWKDVSAIINKTNEESGVSLHPQIQNQSQEPSANQVNTSSMNSNHLNHHMAHPGLGSSMLSLNKKPSTNSTSNLNHPNHRPIHLNLHPQNHNYSSLSKPTPLAPRQSLKESSSKIKSSYSILK